LFAASACLAGCGSPDDQRPPQWSYIYPAIIQPSCATASCHSDLTQRSGVDLGDADLAINQLVCRHYVITCPAVNTMDMCNNNALVTVPPAADCATRAVDDSQILRQMRAQGALRMPPDFALPNADIDLIAQWIQMGAQNN
jgi:hypothetical protein